MKKILLCLTTCTIVLLTGCSNSQYVVTTPIATNDNIEAFQESNPISYSPVDEDSLIIVDMDKWIHETKKVFEEEPLFDKLVMVEKIEQQTYPIFYVDINMDYLNNSLVESVFMKIVNDIAAANGYWNYEIKDNENNISIRVYTNRDEQEVVEAEINGARTLDSYRTNVSGSFDAVFDGMTVEDVQEKAIASGDLDQDGIDEYILKHQNGFKSIDEYYVIKVIDNEPVKTGQIEHELMLEKGVSQVRILRLKEDSKPRIVVDLGSEGAGRVGYLIFELQNNLPSSIDKGVIDDNSREYFYVDDIDQDGSYEKIMVRRLNTVEPLIATDVKPFYKEDYKLLEREGTFSSNMITKPEDFVKSFVELLSANASGYNVSKYIREYVVSDFILSSTDYDIKTDAIFDDSREIIIKSTGNNQYLAFSAWDNIEIEVIIELFNGELKVKEYNINGIK